MKYYLIAGEASGDLHASHLMAELKKEDPNAEFRFFGGDLMSAEGGTMVKHYREMAYMGFVTVLKNLDKVLRNIKDCQKDIAEYRPDVVILIDYPGFNLKIAEFVKKNLGIPVYYYISPKIWAWKEYRIKSIRRYVDKMFCILPFEVDFYRKHAYPVEYVGNPSVDELIGKYDKEAAAKRFDEEEHPGDKPIVALLAGSRKQEVKANLPVMLEAMSAFPDYQGIVAGAPGLDAEFYRSVIGDKPVRIVYGKTYDLLSASHAALVTSGTATLETALLDVPQVVCYKVSGGRLTYEVMSRVLKIEYVSLVNLIADDEVVRELLAHKFTVDSAVEELRPLLGDTPQRRSMLAGYEAMRDKLGKPGAPEEAAKRMVAFLSE